jgi:fructose-bisphosphate aldolase class II
MGEMVRRALRERYAVAAFNIVNDLTMEAVLAAAEEARAPVIVQTSVKTVNAIGVDVLAAMWGAMTRESTVPVALHLDHCPDRKLVSTCFDAGWGSALFDGSALTIDENRRQCIGIVEEARRLGASVEGEIEAIQGVEDDIGSEQESAATSLEIAVEFIRTTGVDVFAPSIGNRHGVYRTPPRLDADRVTALVEATGVPMALHGGTGIPADQVRELVARGCAKMNVSTALKLSFLGANREYLVANPDLGDPPALFRHVRRQVMDMAIEHMKLLGSVGRGL